ncbi:ABC transporter permease [Kribbella hippodromi]|uniref:ABC transporter permease n=1 Tax=Kribbella hippodromi TaxID=434347 RepID=A0ABN2D9Z3_9ACTN
MTMLGLALRSVRYRLGGFVATFVNVFLGAMTLMAFASLYDSAAGPGVSAADKTSLTTISGVVGGWGLVIVAFGVASTMSLSVRQRQAELALLKAAGATPAQVGLMVIGEGVLVSVAACLVAIVPAILVGSALLAALVSSGQIAESVSFRFGAVALGGGLAVTLIASVLATVVTSRRAGRVSAREALVQASIEPPRLGRRRVILGLVLLVVGVSCAVTTTTVADAEGFLTMSLAGQSGIATAIGLALLSPALLRAAVALVQGPIGLFSGAPGELAASNVRQRTKPIAAITMPVIVFTSVAIETFYIQEIQNAANKAIGLQLSLDDKGVQTLNFVIVAMIAAFAGIIVVNNCVATMIARRREFGLARLLGATRTQVLGMVAVESVIALVAGVVLGTVAAALAVGAYLAARSDALTTGPGAGIYLGVVATITVLTIGASLLATRTALAAPAVEATAR